MVDFRKRALNQGEKDEHARVIDFLANLTEQTSKLTQMTPSEVSAALNRSVKTLEKDRARQRQLRKGQDANAALQPTGTEDENAKAPSALPAIQPNDPAALKFSQPTVGGPVSYSAAHVIEYLIACHNAAENSLNRGAPPVARSFQTWLREATAIDTWPFTICADGRPIDLFGAIEDGLLTGEAERLTPREFGDRFAHAASAAFHEGEKRALEPAAEKVDVEKIESSDRWG